MNHGFAVWYKDGGYPAGQPAGNPRVYSTKPTAQRLVTRWNNDSPGTPFEVREVCLVDGFWVPLVKTYLCQVCDHKSRWLRKGGRMPTHSRRRILPDGKPWFPDGTRTCPGIGRVPRKVDGRTI